MSQDLHSLTLPITSSGTTTATEFSVDYINENIALEYDASYTYEVGDLVTHGGYLYVCQEEITTPEQWNIDHWQSTSIGNELYSVWAYKEDNTNKVTSLSSASTDTEYPSAKAVYEANERRIPKFYSENKNLANTALVNSVSDSDNGKLKSLKIYGKGSQQSYTGKNLIPLNVITRTVNGITYTAQSNGTITAVGTASTTGQAWYYPLSNDLSYATSMALDNGQTYIMSQTNTNRAFVRAFLSDGTYTDYVAGTPFVADNSHKYGIAINIGITSGQSYNKAIKIQLEKASTATEWEPYVGGIPAPNPSYPQAIHSVVNPSMRVCGKNLLNPNIHATIPSYVTYTINADGSVTITNSAPSHHVIWWVGFWQQTTSVLDIAIGESLTCNNCSLQVYNQSTGSWSSYSKTYTKSSNNEVINGVYYSVSANSTVTLHPQIEKGNTATAYEPYKSQSATLSKTLNAIPVSTGGNIAIDGQQYIADYVDVERKKLVRMCEKIASYNGETITEPWLSSKDVYAAGATPTTGATVAYALATPTEESLTDAEVADFLAMRSYYPQTNVSVTSTDLDGQATFLYPNSMVAIVEHVKTAIGDSRTTYYE